MLEGIGLVLLFLCLPMMISRKYHVFAPWVFFAGSALILKATML